MAVNRRTIWLGVVLVVLLVVAAVVWTSGGGPIASTPPRAPAPGQPNAGAAAEAPAQVQLDALKVDRGEPAEAERNPFRFGSRAPEPPAGGTLAPPVSLNQAAAAPVMPAMPAGPPPPPPIPLKFIGVVTQGDTRVAVLSDGKSAPVSGTEGAIILGQYRILKIGEESIEMSYVDGRGRQTIRLTGQ